MALGWNLLLNQASPFIRYDTGDDIEPVEFKNGVLHSFRIREGRSGDFVIDRHGARIPLTALIFGRHHELFNLAKFLQVRQEERGRMTVLVTPKSKLPEGFDFKKWFDDSGLAMDTTFQVLESPILTPAGKVALRVSPLQANAAIRIEPGATPSAPADRAPRRTSEARIAMHTEIQHLFDQKAASWSRKYESHGTLRSEVIHL